MAQHKWHKEIKAWADGAEIEMRWSDGEVHDKWRDVHNGFNWNSDLAEFRIKPQPKDEKPKYLYAYLESNGNYKFGRFNCKYNGQKPIGKIKLEVDDE